MVAGKTAVVRSGTTAVAFAVGRVTGESAGKTGREGWWRVSGVSRSWRPGRIRTAREPSRRSDTGNAFTLLVATGDRPSSADGRRVGVVKRSAVGTGPLRRSPAVHSQPIDLVVFQEPS